MLNFSPEHTLDSIAIGIVEARSFLFSYGDAGSGAEADKKKKGGAGLTDLLTLPGQNLKKLCFP